MHNERLCKNERWTSGITDTTYPVQPPTLVFRRSWSHYTSPDSLLLIFNQNCFMGGGKRTQRQHGRWVGPLCPRFRFVLPSGLLKGVRAYVDQKLHLNFEDPGNVLAQSGPYRMGHLIVLPVLALMCVFGPLCKMRGRDHWSYRSV